MTYTNAAQSWRQFDQLELEQKETLLEAVRQRLLKGHSASNEELRPFAFLLPVLEMKIEEHKVAPALQKLLDELPVR